MYLFLVVTPPPLSYWLDHLKKKPFLLVILFVLIKFIICFLCLNDFKNTFGNATHITYLANLGHNLSKRKTTKIELPFLYLTRYVLTLIVFRLEGFFFSFSALKSSVYRLNCYSLFLMVPLYINTYTAHCLIMYPGHAWTLLSPGQTVNF